MEIPSAWRVQSVIARVRVGKTVSSMDVVTRSGVKDPSHTLKNMDCLEISDPGGLGGYGDSRKPTVYKREKLPGKICEDCPFEVGSSSGCVLARPKMAIQFNLKQVMVTPST